MDFHSKNVSSNLTSLNIKYEVIPLLITKPKPTSATLPNTVFYSMRFASIIPPRNLANFSLSNSLTQKNTKQSVTKKSSKLYLKQSYMMVAWVYYLKFLAADKVKAAKNSNDIKTPSFAVLPLKQKRFTLTKAPMAHKTYSQEQYLFRFYFLVLSYKTPSNELYKLDITNSIFLLLRQREIFNCFGTNLLFLKRFRIKLTVSDINFFKIF